MEVCRAWGGLTLDEWGDLPREDRELRLALHRAEVFPMTPEQVEQSRAEQRRQSLRAKHQANAPRGIGVR